MQETKTIVSREIHLFGRCIFSFQTVRTTYEAPVGVMTEIIDRVARKLDISMEVVDES